jgi:hypothetical protein
MALAHFCCTQRKVAKWGDFLTRVAPFYGSLPHLVLSVFRTAQAGCALESQITRKKYTCYSVARWYTMAHVRQECTSEQQK